MSDHANFAIIADSSRLGGELLKRILTPLVPTRTLSPGQTLEDSFSNDSSPALLLISYDWPDLVRQLRRIVDKSPHTQIVLLTSPDHVDQVELDPAVELLSIINKPYQAKEVVHCVVQALKNALNRDSDTPQDHAAAENNVPLSSVLERDLAFCKRYGLMLSAMSVQINEYQNLCAEVGRHAVDETQTSLEKKIRALLRHEDSLCLRQPGLIALSLPGTPPLGARVIAHRLCSWIEQQEFSQDHYSIHFSISIGIHCCVPGTEVDAQSFLSTTARTAQEVPKNGESHIHLSEYTQAITGEKNHSPDLEPWAKSTHFWETLDCLLSHPDLNDPENQDAILNRLNPILISLSEVQRLKLVDQLLVASVSPGAAQ